MIFISVDRIFRTICMCAWNDNIIDDGVARSGEIFSYYYYTSDVRPIKMTLMHIERLRVSSETPLLVHFCARLSRMRAAIGHIILLYLPWHVQITIYVYMHACVWKIRLHFRTIPITIYPRLLCVFSSTTAYSNRWQIITRFVDSGQHSINNI